jgi:hypothetical protein
MAGRHKVKDRPLAIAQPAPTSNHKRTLAIKA